LQQFAPIFERTVGSHQRGALFIAAQDHFQEDFPGFGGRLLTPMSSISSRSGLRYWARVRSNSAGNGRLENRAPSQRSSDKKRQNRLDDMGADGLPPSGFSPRRAALKRAHRRVGAQTARWPVDRFRAFNDGIKLPVKVLQGLRSRKPAALTRWRSGVLADIQLVLEEQFQELLVRELMAGGLLKAHFQGGQYPTSGVGGPIGSMSYSWIILC